MDPLDVGVQADDRVVSDQALDRGRDRVPDDLDGGRVRSELGDGELSRMRRPRSECANDLGRRVGRAGAALAQTSDERFDQVVVGLVERLHFELTEARRDLAPVETDTSSSTTSATWRPSPSLSSVCRRTVLTGPVAEAVPSARTRSRDRRPPEAAGGRRPGTRAPRGRASPPRACGSLTVQPSLVRWRRLTPQPVSRRSSVSK